MFKLAIVVLVVLFAVAYSNNPSSFKPWGKVIGQISVIVAKMVKDSGEATNKLFHEMEHDNIVIDKTKDAVIRITVASLARPTTLATVDSPLQLSPVATIALPPTQVFAPIVTAHVVTQYSSPLATMDASTSLLSPLGDDTPVEESVISSFPSLTPDGSGHYFLWHMHDATEDNPKPCIVSGGGDNLPPYCNGFTVQPAMRGEAKMDWLRRVGGVGIPTDTGTYRRNANDL